MKIPLLPFTALILTLLLYTSCQENRFKIIEFYEEPSLPLQVLCDTPENNIKCITLCTHATIDRLHLLPIQNLYWQGPMSIAITINNSEEDWNKLNDFLKEHFNSKNEDATSIASFASIHVIVSNEPITKHNYPINLVRNIAIKNSYTDWVFAIDVDFIPTSSGHLKALQHKKFILNSYMASSKKAAFVIPAFEIEKPRKMKIYELPYTQMKEALQNILPNNKQSLYDMYKSEQIMGFHEKSFPKGHAQTDLNKWFEVNESYEVKYKDKYEPFLLFNRKNTPQFDESFEGRYYNKVHHVWELNRLKFKFFVLKDIYIIHLNHKKFSDPETRELNLKKFHEKTKRSGSKEEINRIVYEDFKEGTDEGIDSYLKENILVNNKLELNLEKMIIPGWSCVYGKCNYKKCSINHNRLCLVISPTDDADLVVYGYPHRYMNVIAQTIDTTSIENEILELQLKMIIMEKVNIQELPLEVWIEIHSIRKEKSYYRTYSIEIEQYNELIDMNILSFKPFTIHDCSNIASISIALVYNTESSLSQNNLIIDSIEASLLLGYEKIVKEKSSNEEYTITRNIFNVNSDFNKSITLVGHSYVEDIQEVRDSLIKFGNEEMLSLSLYSLNPSIASKVLKEESHWLKNHLVHIVTPKHNNLKYPENILVKTAIDASSTEWIMLTDLNIKIPICFNIKELKNDINRLRNELNLNVFILPVYEDTNHCDISRLKLYEGKFNMNFLRGNTIDDENKKVDQVGLIPYPFPIIFRSEEFPEQEDFVRETKEFTSLTNLWILNLLSNQNDVLLLNKYFLYHHDDIYTTFDYKSDIEKIYDFLRYLNELNDE